MAKRIVEIPATQQEELVDLCCELKKEEYFCASIGGVVRDMAWITDNLKRRAIQYRDAELADALTRLIQEGFIQLAYAAGTNYHYLRLTAASRSHR